MKEIATYATMLLMVLYIGITHFEHKSEIKKITNSYEAKITDLNKKHSEVVKRLETDYNTLNVMYTERENDVVGFQKKQEKYMSEIDRLIQASKQKPKLVEKIINQSFDKYMENMYNETNNEVNVSGDGN